MGVISPSQTEIYPNASLFVLPSWGKLIPLNSRGVLHDQNQQDLHLGTLNLMSHAHGQPSVLRQSPAEDHGRGFLVLDPVSKQRCSAQQHSDMSQWRDEDLREATVRHKRSVCRYREVFCLPLPTVCGVTQSHAHIHGFHTVDFVENRLKNAIPIVFPNDFFLVFNK